MQRLSAASAAVASQQVSAEYVGCSEFAPLARRGELASWCEAGEERALLTHCFRDKACDKDGAPPMSAHSEIGGTRMR